MEGTSGLQQAYVEPGCLSLTDEFKHSGETFDWWRCNKDGRIIKPRPPPEIYREPWKPPPKRIEPGMCWPLFRGKTALDTYQEALSKETTIKSDDCEISEDFWPDKWDRGAGKKYRLQHQRPPWVPSMLPNKWGVVKYPPPYTLYCRDRDKPINFVVKP